MEEYDVEALLGIVGQHEDILRIAENLPPSSRDGEALLGIQRVVIASKKEAFSTASRLRDTLFAYL